MLAASFSINNLLNHFNALRERKEHKRKKEIQYRMKLLFLQHKNILAEDSKEMPMQQ